MRLLVLTPVFPPARGGIEILTARLVEQLAARFEVAVVALDAAGSAVDDPRYAVERVPNVPAGGRRSILRLNAAAVARAARFRPDVVLVMHIKASPAAHLIRRTLGAPFVQYLHAKELLETPHLATFAVQGADRIVGVSRYSRQLALDAGADPGRVVVIPNATDPVRATGTERDGRPTLITVSRLVDRYKGHDVVLRALPLVRERVPDARWIVIGDGPLRQELEDSARGHAVEFLGAVDDATRDEWLDRATIFVMPSRHPGPGRAGEGFGIAFLEAAAHGLPVVAGRVPGVVDAVADGESGLLVDPTSHTEVARAIGDLLTDRALAARMAAAARRRVERFSWPVVAGEVEEVLRGVASSPHRRRPVGHSLDARWLLDLVRPPAVT